jgi:SAM-dependent methyltransferase
VSNSDSQHEVDEESETSLEESSDEILELDEQVGEEDDGGDAAGSDSADGDVSKHHRETEPSEQPTTDRIPALNDEQSEDPTDRSGGQKAASSNGDSESDSEEGAAPSEKPPSAAVVKPSESATDRSDQPAASPSDDSDESVEAPSEDERSTDEVPAPSNEPGDIESVTGNSTGVSGESVSETQDGEANGAASGLHETIQMEALDRAAIEREGQFRELEQTQPVLDNRMAPEVVAAPPEHRLTQWRPLAEVLDELESPAAVNPSPGSPDASDIEEDDEAGRARRPTPAARPAASAAAENPGAGGPPPTEGLDDGSRKREHNESLADAISDATGEESRRPVDPTSDTAPAPAEAIDPAASSDQPEVPTQEAQSLEVPDWIEQAFGEHYLMTVSRDVQRQTSKQADFIEESLDLTDSDRVLDLACGFGRHTIELASRGYQVVGFDLSKPLLERAVKEANRNSLQVNFIHGDMRALQFDGVFDACFCWQTSFGYFDDDTNLNILRRLHRALQPGGELLLEVVNRDYVVDDMPHRRWWEGTECVFLEEGEFDSESSTMHLERSFIYEDGRQPLEHDYFIRIYSLHELKRMCRKAGFEPIEVSGAVHYRGEFLGADSPQIIVRAAAT